MSRTVSEVAALTGVTVRTLHHYDEIGLVSPEERTEAGYRLYGDQDLARLHDALFWRSLGFPLEEVRALLDDPDRDALEAMAAHRERLLAELGEVGARLAALDAAIARASAGRPWTDDDLTALFDGFDPAVYEAEVEERWGDTEAYAESRRRTSRYGRAEWEAVKREQEEVTVRLAELCAGGVAAEAPEARSAAEAHRAHIERWFYDCTPEIHLGLGEMYVADPRFTAFYDDRVPGLAAWVRDAIRALHTERPRRL
ncbi:MAG: MerR family transcriptional regulator [Alphaproteobacteria bacterium]|nr:MerR family transcriptional regulator [Alphaproteobacteria bacterium]